MAKRQLEPNREKTAQRNLKRIWDAKKKLLGLTQDAAAELLGFTTQGAVQKYLSGSSPLNVKTILGFAHILGVSPTDIDPEFEYNAKMKNAKNDRIDIHSAIEMLPVEALDDARMALQIVQTRYKVKPVLRFQGKN